MKVIRSEQIEEYFLKGSCVALGTFDGVHKGHQAILNKCVKVSNEKGLKSLTVTFNLSPSAVFRRVPVRVLTSKEEKNSIIDDIGIDAVCYLDNLTDVFNMTAENFFENILKKTLRAKAIVMGFNFCFGKERKGNAEFMKKCCEENNIFLFVQEPVNHENNLISSTLIRNQLIDGLIEKANQLLGRSYSLSGKVVGGRQMGRKMGFPTANIELSDDYKLIPKNGVYVVSIELENIVKYGVMNIGWCPTVNEDCKNITLEVNIFDFHGILYGEKLKVNFLKRLRNEKAFVSRSQLIEQVSRDIKEAKIFINSFYSSK